MTKDGNFECEGTSILQCKSAEKTLQTDASKKGLGACLIQNGEQNYQNLE